MDVQLFGLASSCSSATPEGPVVHRASQLSGVLNGDRAGEEGRVVRVWATPSVRHTERSRSDQLESTFRAPCMSAVGSGCNRCTKADGQLWRVASV